MALNPGTQLGAYQIVAAIGAGGMGEVYEAADSKLGRSVAIKILPEMFARDAERVARLEREARVLASLNHPHIAAIYGLEESAGRNLLVMELVSGETLAERIARGAIRVDEALPIASQILEALEAAHAKGVAHRDLKPANIKVTAAGQVKVLDFGLAKAFGGDAAESKPSESPTLSMAATNAGVILGTAAYMSPEQARGNPVDHRTDIFAFGSVLYEMLTGQQAFRGDTVSDILAAVLKVEPDWSRLPEDTPAAIRRLLRRCLQKDRTRRLHAAADARIDIEEARAAPEDVKQTATAAAHPSARVAWIVAGMAIVAGLVLAIPGFRRQAPPAEAPEMRVQIPTPALTGDISIAISPDGRQLVYSASGDGAPRLWLRSLDTLTARPLAGTENARLPFWSPDSRSIGFFDFSKLKRIDIDGGTPQTLADATPGWGGTWSPDNTILFSPIASTPLLRVSASAAGEVLTATKIGPGQNGHRFPQFLPGGRRFIFYTLGNEDTQGIYLGSLDDSATRRLTASDTAGLYVEPGWLLFPRQGTLTAQRFDVERGELTGEPITLSDSLSPTRQGNRAFSAAGIAAIAYVGDAAASKSQLTWYDRSGKSFGTFGPPDANSLSNPELSPDGRRVVVNRFGENNMDVWLWDNVRATPFTFSSVADQYAVWSPDGLRVAFGSAQKGPFDVYVKPANSPGSEAHSLFQSPLGKNLDDWSADGRFLLYNTEDPNTGRDLYALPLDKDGKPGTPIEFVKTRFQEHRGQFSPDGHWVAYVTNESRQTEINVRAFPPAPSGGQWQVSTGGGIQPRWSPDGKELYYIAPDSKLMAVPITIKDGSLEPGAPVPLFQTRISGGFNIYTRPQYDVASGGRFLINVTTEDSITSAITLLLNWKPAK